MKTLHTIKEIRTSRATLAEPVGFVPTMGFLHPGHLALVKQAQAECASVVVSIFVNPTQFGPAEDFTAYPRDLARDLDLLKPLNVDVVWAPEAGFMYPPGFQTYVTVEEITQPLEGAMRPGHFRGVTTVVAKLLNIVQPQRLYLGQKDAQQAAVLRRMILDLNFPVEVVVCPTVRESDGLAMSSRNTYLTPEQRRAAAVLYRGLRQAEALYLQGERSAETLRQAVRQVLAQEPLAQPQYVSCADRSTLLELDVITAGALLSLAVYFGKTRLIDNWVLLPENEE